MASVAEPIKDMLNELTNLTFEPIVTDSLTKTLSGYNSDVTNEVLDIMQNSVYAIGASLLTLFMLIELASLITRANTDNSLRGMQIPANILIKFAILAFLYCHLPDVLNGIQEIAVRISNNISSSTTANTGLDASQIDILYNAIEDTGIIQRIVIYILVLLEWLAMRIIVIIVNTVVIFRMFEMWILLAFAPIPLSTIASAEFRQTCFNYLKNFAALALQSSVILLSFRIYSALLNSSIATFSGSDVMQFMLTMFGKNIGYLIVLVVSVMASGRVAKSILQAS